MIEGTDVIGGRSYHDVAPAKLTLSLRILGRRKDGMHTLEAEMVSVSLCDELEFSEGDSLDIEMGTETGFAVSEGADNLVNLALAAVGQKAAVKLRKRIPAGAGLGGGSADAAAVFRWAGLAEHGHVPDKKTLELAASTGSDVPFCLAGGRAIVTGMGEQVIALPFENRRFAVLSPPLAVSTAAVYGAWDAMGPTRSKGPNHLERAALVVEPELGTWRDALASITEGAPVLAGSGSSWFVEITESSKIADRTVVEVHGSTAEVRIVSTYQPGVASELP